jgi:hypothetical protein
VSEKKSAEKYVEIASNMAASKSMGLSRQLDKMNAAQLRNLTATLLAELDSRDKELKAKQLKIDQLTHEMAIGAASKWTQYSARSWMRASMQTLRQSALRSKR